MKNPSEDEKKKKNGRRPRRVYRGGSWYNSAWNSRVSYRDNDVPTYRLDLLGFRVVRNTNSKS